MEVMVDTDVESEDTEAVMVLEEDMVDMEDMDVESEDMEVMVLEVDMVDMEDSGVDMEDMEDTTVKLYRYKNNYTKEIFNSEMHLRL